MRDLHDEVWRPFDVVVVTNVGLTPTVGLNAEQGVRLGIVVEIETDGGVISNRDVRGGSGVSDQPPDDGTVGMTVGLKMNGRGHIDGAFDQFGFLTSGMAAYRRSNSRRVRRSPLTRVGTGGDEGEDIPRGAICVDLCKKNGEGKG